MLDINFDKVKYKIKHKIDKNSSFENLDQNEKKEILTKDKVIRILKEIEKRRNRRKSRFYRIKDFFKNLLICFTKFIKKKYNS